MNNTQWSDLLFNISISVLGGLVKCITTKKRKKELSYYVASAVIGGFAGLLTYMLCSNFKFGWEITSFATGVAGYMGDSILNLFTELLPKLLKGKINIQIDGSVDNNSKQEKQEDRKGSK